MRSPHGSFDPQNLQEFERRFMRILQAVVKQTPADWSGGILIIEKTPQGVRCDLFEDDHSQAIAVHDSVIQPSRQFASFKRTDNWANDWSTVTIRYSFDDPSVDYTATREFSYPETNQPAVDSSFFPDATFWKQETANKAWQRSPSLLVIEFILDCEAWGAVPGDSSATLQQKRSQLIHKFCGSNSSIDWAIHLEPERHRISDESVYSVETVGAQSVVQTMLHTAERFFEYRLVYDGDRWRLDTINQRAARAENMSDLGFDGESIL